MTAIILHAPHWTLLEVWPCSEPEKDPNSGAFVDMLHSKGMIWEGINYNSYDVSLPTTSVVLEPSVHTKGTL